MYRDLTENKPPLGYWLFDAAVSIGRANELTVRLMPIPLVLATIAIVWWLGLRLGGPGTAVLAAITCAVLSTDPFLYGNGNQMEQMINLFSMASLAALVLAWDRPGRSRIWVSGLFLGMAALVKQVAGVNLFLFSLILLLHKRPAGDTARTVRERSVDILGMVAGFALAWGVAAAILAIEGGAQDAYNDIFHYGPALATDTPPPPNAPSFLVRWFAGNADPAGQLPWPFGKVDGLSRLVGVRVMADLARGRAGSLVAHDWTRAQRPAQDRRGLDPLRLGAGRLAGALLGRIITCKVTRAGPCGGRFRSPLADLLALASRTRRPPPAIGRSWS